MSINFGQLKTNVGNRVGDTSSALATIIGSFINHRYKDILRRTNFYTIDEDYTITATAGTRDYELPSNFGKELYVYNNSASEDVPYKSLEYLEELYPDDLDDTGIIEAYTIFMTPSSTAASAPRVKKLRFYHNPSTAYVFTIPYILSPADLSGAADELVLDCETAVEYGATADAWAYKRQFGKAQYYEALYEKAIQILIWDKEFSPNQPTQFAVEPLDRDLGI